MRPGARDHVNTWQGNIVEIYITSSLADVAPVSIYLPHLR
jgi:hypothetical protein